MPLALTTVGAVIVSSWAAFLLVGGALISLLWQGQGPALFHVPQEIAAVYAPADLWLWLAVGLALVTLLALAIPLAYIYRHQLFERHRFTAALWTIGCTLLLALLLKWRGYVGPWYPIDEAMQFEAEAPYAHRILFVLVARAFQFALPFLSNLQAFFLSQCFAILLAMLAVRRWAALFVGEDRAHLAQTLLVVILVPTISYFTFYDFGTVFFSAFGLTLLHQGRLRAYLPLVALATLNHELILFLILLSFVLYYRRLPRAQWLLFCLAQLALWMAVRAVLFWLMPMERAWLDGKFWVNLHYLVVTPSKVSATLLLFLWFAAAGLAALRTSSTFLRQCLWLLPMLLGMTLIVGQINEARLFVAFVPVAIALILSDLEARGPVHHEKGASMLVPPPG